MLEPAEQLDGLLQRAGFEDTHRSRSTAPGRPQDRGGLTMADSEKPTSIWKKEISLRKKDAEARAGPRGAHQPELSRTGA